jgi:hypothetical protein
MGFTVRMPYRNAASLLSFIPATVPNGVGMGLTLLENSPQLLQS